MNTTLSADQRWFFFRILPEVSDHFSLGLTKRIAASGNEIENMDVQYQIKNKLYMPSTLKASKCDILHLLTWKGRQVILSQPKFFRYIDNQILLTTVLRCLRFRWNQCVWSAKLSHWALLPVYIKARALRRRVEIVNYSPDLVSSSGK